MFRKKFLYGLFVAAGLVSVACNSTKKSDAPMYIHDPHSYAMPNTAVVKHLALDLKVDFDKKELSGSATWDITHNDEGDTIYFDTRDLKIQDVTIDGEKATFTLDKAKGVFGQRLAVVIKDDTKSVTINYTTSPQAAALQWLDLSQTAGKQKPFLFSQSQAILARSWIPCQDSPGIRFTYDAKIIVPADYLALMSAENPQEKNPEGVYNFSMKQAIPSYLMALAVGDIVFRPVGDRTGVYAEPVTVDKASYEFSQMQDMLVAAESLYGPYAWGRYDLLVLPPSFPFGGMENPRLTFATPTVIAGDRSLASLVAHEMAHSWSGNLVTNATWNDFWLNEGFTVYFERRIMEAIEGKEYADMLTMIGGGELKESVKDFGAKNPDTRLKLELEGRNPDDGVSDIAYEKGFFLLVNIENTVGREKFDAFLKKYFEEHKFKTCTTEEFLTYLKKNLFNNDETAYKAAKVDEWVYNPGLPDNFPKLSSKRFEKVDLTVMQFKAGEPAQQLYTKGWSSHEWLYFLRNLPKDISGDQLKALDEAFLFTQSGNSEILDAWLEICILKAYKPAYPKVEEFLCSVGRRKFLTPLYKALIKTEDGRKRALEIYAKARPGYHAVSRETLDKLLKKV